MSHKCNYWWSPFQTQRYNKWWWANFRKRRPFYISTVSLLYILRPFIREQYFNFSDNRWPFCTKECCTGPLSNHSRLIGSLIISPMKSLYTVAYRRSNYSLPPPPPAANLRPVSKITGAHKTGEMATKNQTLQNVFSYLTSCPLLWDNGKEKKKRKKRTKVNSVARFLICYWYRIFCYSYPLLIRVSHNTQLV